VVLEILVVLIISHLWDLKHLRIRKFALIVFDIPLKFGCEGLNARSDLMT